MAETNKTQTIPVPFLTSAIEKAGLKWKNRKVAPLADGGISFGFGDLPVLGAAKSLLRQTIAPLTRVETLEELVEKTFRAIAGERFDRSIASDLQLQMHTILEKAANNEIQPLLSLLSNFKTSYPEHFQPLLQATLTLSVLLDRPLIQEIIAAFPSPELDKKKVIGAGVASAGLAGLMAAAAIKFTRNPDPKPPKPPTRPDIEPTCPADTCPIPERNPFQSNSQSQTSTSQPSTDPAPTPPVPPAPPADPVPPVPPTPPIVPPTCPADISPLPDRNPFKSFSQHQPSEPQPSDPVSIPPIPTQPENPVPTPPTVDPAIITRANEGLAKAQQRKLSSKAYRKSLSKKVDTLLRDQGPGKSLPTSPTSVNPVPIPPVSPTPRVRLLADTSSIPDRNPFKSFYQTQTTGSQPSTDPAPTPPVPPTPPTDPVPPISPVPPTPPIVLPTCPADISPVPDRNPFKSFSQHQPSGPQPSDPVSIPPIPTQPENPVPTPPTVDPAIITRANKELAKAQQRKLSSKAYRKSLSKKVDTLLRDQGPGKSLPTSPTLVNPVPTPPVSPTPRVRLLADTSSIPDRNPFKSFYQTQTTGSQPSTNPVPTPPVQSTQVNPAPTTPVLPTPPVSLSADISSIPDRNPFKNFYQPQTTGSQPGTNPVPTPPAPTTPVNPVPTPPVQLTSVNSVPTPSTQPVPLFIPPTVVGQSDPITSPADPATIFAKSYAESVQSLQRRLAPRASLKTWIVKSDQMLEGPGKSVVALGETASTQSALIATSQQSLVTTALDSTELVAASTSSSQLEIPKTALDALFSGTGVNIQLFDLQGKPLLNSTGKPYAAFLEFAKPNHLPDSTSAIAISQNTPVVYSQKQVLNLLSELRASGFSFSVEAVRGSQPVKFINTPPGQLPSLSAPLQSFLPHPQTTPAPITKIPAIGSNPTIPQQLLHAQLPVLPHQVKSLSSNELPQPVLTAPSTDIAKGSSYVPKTIFDAVKTETTEFGQAQQSRLTPQPSPKSLFEKSDTPLTRAEPEKRPAVFIENEKNSELMSGSPVLVEMANPTPDSETTHFNLSAFQLPTNQKELLYGTCLPDPSTHANGSNPNSGSYLPFFQQFPAPAASSLTPGISNLPILALPQPYQPQLIGPPPLKIPSPEPVAPTESTALSLVAAPVLEGVLQIGLSAAIQKAAEIFLQPESPALFNSPAQIPSNFFTQPGDRPQSLLKAPPLYTSPGSELVVWKSSPVCIPTTNPTSNQMESLQFTIVRPQQTQQASFDLSKYGTQVLSICRSVADAAVKKFISTVEHGAENLVNAAKTSARIAVATAEAGSQGLQAHVASSEERRKRDLEHDKMMKPLSNAVLTKLAETAANTLVGFYAQTRDDLSTVLGKGQEVLSTLYTYATTPSRPVRASKNSQQCRIDSKPQDLVSNQDTNSSVLQTCPLPSSPAFSTAVSPLIVSNQETTEAPSLADAQKVLQQLFESQPQDIPVLLQFQSQGEIQSLRFDPPAQQALDAPSIIQSHREIQPAAQPVRRVTSSSVTDIRKLIPILQAQGLPWSVQFIKPKEIVTVYSDPKAQQMFSSIPIPDAVKRLLPSPDSSAVHFETSLPCLDDVQPLQTPLNPLWDLSSPMLHVPTPAQRSSMVPLRLEDMESPLTEPESRIQERHLFDQAPKPLNNSVADSIQSFFQHPWESLFGTTCKAPIVAVNATQDTCPALLPQPMRAKNPLWDRRCEANLNVSAQAKQNSVPHSLIPLRPPEEPVPQTPKQADLPIVPNPGQDYTLSAQKAAEVAQNDPLSQPVRELPKQEEGSEEGSNKAAAAAAYEESNEQRVKAKGKVEARLKRKEALHKQANELRL